MMSVAKVLYITNRIRDTVWVLREIQDAMLEAYLRRDFGSLKKLYRMRVQLVKQLVKLYKELGMVK